MRRRSYYKRRKGKKRGREIPYIYKNRIHLRKKPQTCTEAVSRVIARPLENVGDVIGFYCSKRNIGENQIEIENLNRKFNRKYKRKIRGRGSGLYSLGKQWRKSMQ